MFIARLDKKFDYLGMYFLASAMVNLQWFQISTGHVKVKNVKG